MLCPESWIRSALDSSASSLRVVELLQHIASGVANDATVVGAPEPVIKVYPDAVYFNYYSLGITLLYSPLEGYQPRDGALRQDLDDHKLRLESIDIYNAVENGKASNPLFSPFRSIPILFSQPAGSESGKATLEISTVTTGAEFVSYFGEPTRKGGGGGPSGGSIGVWCEWKPLGLMVEFGGEKAKGWETGKDAVWAVITMFESQPKDQ